jgi:hypothetical protein
MKEQSGLVSACPSPSALWFGRRFALGAFVYLAAFGRLFFLSCRKVGH